MQYVTPKNIGDHHKNQILSILRENRCVSRVELSRRMGVSAPAVTRNIAKLLEAGIIRECGADTSAIGRKPVLLEICAEYCYVMGADVVGGGIKIAIADLTGEIVKYSETPLCPEEGTVYEQLLRCLETAIKESGVPRERMRALALGAPGIFDAETGKSRFTLVQGGWEDIDLRGELEKRFAMDVIVDNDVNLDVMGERWKGAGRNYSSVLYVKLGQGVASRFMLEGRLLRGAYHAAGEIGFMMPGGGDGRTYEEMLRNSALAEEYKALAPDAADPKTLSDLLAMRREGDAAARRVVETMRDRLWALLLSCVTMVDPEVIILGGEGSCLEPEDVAYIQRKVEECQPLSRTLLTSRLDRKACVFGAVSAALTRVEDQMIAIL